MPKLRDLETCIDDDPTPKTAVLCAADYPAGEVQWLWPGRIPIGKVTLMVGDPGNGKSLVALDVASRVSRGKVWPEESRTDATEFFSTNQFPHTPGSVLILSAEDDLADTIRPRLDAAGADPRKVFVLPSIVDLRHDLPKLRAAIQSIPDCRLVVIDSINAYVGPGDSHFHTIVRRVLQPLAQLAAEHKLAVLAVSHLRKTEGAAIQRAAGSMGYVAASRAVWTVCRDKNVPGRHLFLPLKNNFVAETTGLAFRIEPPSVVPLSALAINKGLTPAIAWEAVPVKTLTEAALDCKPQQQEDSEVDWAAAWLREELADGPKSAMVIIAEGTMGGGFNERTLRRGLDKIGGSTKKESFDGGWIWSLPEQDSSLSSNSLIPRESLKTRPSPKQSPPSENLSASQNLVRFGEKSTIACPLREIAEDLVDFELFYPGGPPLLEARPIVMSRQASDAATTKFAARPRSP